MQSFWLSLIKLNHIVVYYNVVSLSHCYAFLIKFSSLYVLYENAATFSDCFI